VSPAGRAAGCHARPNRRRCASACLLYLPPPSSGACVGWRPPSASPQSLQRALHLCAYPTPPVFLSQPDQTQWSHPGCPWQPWQ
jgi:hypothetical protein